MLNPYFRNSLIIAASCFLLAAQADQRARPKSGKEPLVITANRMEAEDLGEKIVFTGNVTMKKEGMTLSSDTMIVLYDNQVKAIREIEAHGNVIMKKEGRVALSRDATYYSREEKIIMTGDAKIIENKNQLGGEKITLFMRNDRSIVESGKVTIFEDVHGAQPGKKQRK